MKVSIIVTVYNCEKYIQRCLETLQRQTYNDYEILIVDDGSQDVSAKICDEFASVHSNVQVLHKDNGGTVSARKAGLMASRGDVVCFIDGDDWVDVDFCEKLIYPFLQNDKVQMVSSGLNFEYVLEPEKNFTLFDGVDPGLWDGEKIKKNILQNLFYDEEKEKSAITSSICCKMFKRELAIEAMQDIDERLTLGEDGAYVLSLLTKINSMFVLNKAYYHYEQHEGSQNYKFNLYAFEQLQLLERCMEKIIEGEKNYYKLKTQIGYFVKGHLRRVESSMFNFNRDELVYIFPEVDIARGSRIVIHGAGSVGMQYVKYLKKNHNYELVAWTDKYKGNNFIAPDVPCLIKELSKIKYDYVILAANDDCVLAQMVDDLCKNDIDANKIIIKKPLLYRI